jgi:hypothetical protein
MEGPTSKKTNEPSKRADSKVLFIKKEKKGRTTHTTLVGNSQPDKPMHSVQILIRDMSMKPELTLARAHMMKGRDRDKKTIRQENSERKWSQEGGGKSLCHWSVCVCVCVCVMCRFSVKGLLAGPLKSLVTEHHISSPSSTV